MYNDACAYMDFVDGVALEQYNEKIESQKAFLAEQIAKLNDVIRSQKQNSGRQVKCRGQPHAGIQIQYPGRALFVYFW